MTSSGALASVSSVSFRRLAEARGGSERVGGVSARVMVIMVLGYSYLPPLRLLAWAHFGGAHLGGWEPGGAPGGESISIRPCPKMGQP